MTAAKQIQVSQISQAVSAAQAAAYAEGMVCLIVLRTDKPMVPFYPQRPRRLRHGRRSKQLRRRSIPPPGWHIMEDMDHRTRSTLQSVLYVRNPQEFLSVMRTEVQRLSGSINRGSPSSRSVAVAGKPCFGHKSGKSKLTTVTVLISDGSSSGTECMGALAKAASGSS